MQECSCSECQQSCRYKPGWFMPGEAERVAELLEISLQELFDTKLGVDWWVADNNVYLLTPATTSMCPGEEYPENPKGQCIFFLDGLCSIHSVKPYECKESHCSNNKEEVCSRHEEVAETWKLYQVQIKQLLGYEPEAEEPGGLFSFLSW